MRRSSTLSPQRPSTLLAPIWNCGTTWPRRLGTLLALVCSITAAAGCVSKGRYDGVVSDKRALERRVELLEASSRSLDAERAKLLDEFEDLRISQEKLDAKVARLRRVEADLSERLSRRESELTASVREVDQLRGTYEGLLSDLEAEVASGQIEIEQLREGLRLNMTQDVLFASGSAQVNSGGRAVLGKVAERLQGVPHGVVVEGHTDDVPIHSERFPTNWELAGGRAAGVVRILEAHGIDPVRLTVVSRGETSPRDSNATPEGRARNRRIEITLEPVRDSSPAAPAAEPEGTVPGS
ncbi:MAG: OmpA family protein [Myxococcota bacterium]|nr:OmpA family protein [Myxococcota bacterium]MDP6241950.1 OmpA family protein [Myxococcota bacterium]